MLISNSFIRYFSNTAWLFGEKIFYLLSALFVGAWLARYLGPSEFGLLSYILTFVGIVAVIADFGVRELVVLELVRGKHNRDLILGSAFVIHLVGALLTIGCVILITSYISDDLYTNTLILIVSTATLFQSSRVISLYFESQVLSKYIVHVNVIGQLISLFIKIILILKHYPLEAFIWVVLFDNVILALGYILVYKKNGLKFRDWSVDYKLIIKLLQRGWPMIVAGFAVIIYLKIDQVMIKELLGSYAVGQYAAAVKISEIWYFIPTAIASSLFPAIINLKMTNHSLYLARLQDFYTLMVLLSVLIALPVSYLGDWIINLIYGSQYSQAGAVLVLHIWAGIFVFLGVASGKWLLNEKLQKYIMINQISGAFINIILNYILIPAMGVEGAAWGTIISSIFSSYLMLIFFDKTRSNFLSLTESLLLIPLFRKIKYVF